MKFKKNDKFTIGIIVIGILASFTLFLPSMAFSSDDTPFTGFELVFGTEFVNFGTWASGNIHLSVFGILGYILPLVAVYTTLFVKNGSLYAIFIFACSTVLLYLMPEYIKTTVSLLNTTTEIQIQWVTAYGIIVAQLLSILGVVFSALETLNMSSKKIES